MSPQLTTWLSTRSDEFPLEHVARLAAELHNATRSPLPDPQIMRREDGSLSLAWDLPPYQFTVDLLPNGLIDWFYRDRRTEDYGGGEDVLPTELPTSFTARFTEAVVSHEV